MHLRDNLKLSGFFRISVSRNDYKNILLTINNKTEMSHVLMSTRHTTAYLNDLSSKNQIKQFQIEF